jgi:cytochrome c556
MKSFLRFSLVASTLLLGSALLATDTAPAAVPAPTAPAPAPKEKKIETELSKQMEKLNGAFRKLRRQSADATKNADSLEQVAILKKYGQEALKFEPYKATEVPADEKAKLIEGYKAKMNDFIAAVGKLEEAFKANNNEEAAKIVQELGAMQKEGHKEYKSKTLN